MDVPRLVCDILFGAIGLSEPPTLLEKRMYPTVLHIQLEGYLRCATAATRVATSMVVSAIWWVIVT